MKRIKLFFLSQPQLKTALIAAAVSELLLLALVWLPVIVDPASHAGKPLLRFDDQVGLALFTGVPLLIITIVQIYHSTLINRSVLVKEFASKLHTEPSLSEAFFYLVYSYDNKLYQEFVKAAPEQQAAIQGSRAEGRRLYDPNKFQGTEEERRLDALLGFLDIVAFHYHRGVMPMRDIAGSMGFHLSAIATRNVMVDYRREIPTRWKSSSFTNPEYESLAPGRYLDLMLKDYSTYCKANKDEIDKLNRTRI